MSQKRHGRISNCICAAAIGGMEIIMLKRFVAYYKPHMKIFIMDMLASLFVALIGIVYPMITRKMLNDFIPNENYALIIAFGCCLLGLYFVRMFLNFFIQYYGHVMGVRMQAQVKSDPRT